MKNTVLLIFIFFSLFSFKVLSMGKNTLIYSAKFGVGPKGPGAGLALKYFFIDDLGAELEFGGSNSYSGWEFKVSYYPPFFNDYGYFNLGFSQLTFDDKLEKDGIIYDGKCNAYALNASGGISTKKFSIPVLFSQEEEPRKCFIAYLESGLAKILSSEVKEVYGITIKDNEAYENSKSEYNSKTLSSGWLFPDVKFGYGVDLIPKDEE